MYTENTERLRLLRGNLCVLCVLINLLQWDAHLNTGKPGK